MQPWSALVAVAAAAVVALAPRSSFSQRDELQQAKRPSDVPLGAQQADPWMEKLRFDRFWQAAWWFLAPLAVHPALYEHLIEEELSAASVGLS